MGEAKRRKQMGMTVLEEISQVVQEKFPELCEILDAHKQISQLVYHNTVEMVNIETMKGNTLYATLAGVIATQYLQELLMLNLSEEQKIAATQAGRALIEKFLAAQAPPK